MAIQQGAGCYIHLGLTPDQIKKQKANLASKKSKTKAKMTPLVDEVVALDPINLGATAQKALADLASDKIDPDTFQTVITGLHTQAKKNSLNQGVQQAQTAVHQAQHAQTQAASQFNTVQKTDAQYIAAVDKGTKAYIDLTNKGLLDEADIIDSASIALANGQITIPEFEDIIDDALMAMNAGPVPTVGKTTPTPTTGANGQAISTNKPAKTLDEIEDTYQEAFMDGTDELPSYEFYKDYIAYKNNHPHVMEVPHAGDHPWTPPGIQDVPQFDQVVGDWLVDKSFDNVPVTKWTIDPSKVTASQYEINPMNIALQTDEWDAADASIKMFKLHDEYLLMDGHHTFISAQLMGDTTINAYIIDLTPPAVPKATTTSTPTNIGMAPTQGTADFTGWSASMTADAALKYTEGTALPGTFYSGRSAAANADIKQNGYNLDKIKVHGTSPAGVFLTDDKAYAGNYGEVLTYQIKANKVLYSMIGMSPNQEYLRAMEIVNKSVYGGLDQLDLSQFTQAQIDGWKKFIDDSKAAGQPVGWIDTRLQPIVFNDMGYDAFAIAKSDGTLGEIAVFNKQQIVVVPDATQLPTPIIVDNQVAKKQLSELTANGDIDFSVGMQLSNELAGGAITPVEAIQQGYIKAGKDLPPLVDPYAPVQVVPTAVAPVPTATAPVTAVSLEQQAKDHLTSITPQLEKLSKGISASIMEDLISGDMTVQQYQKWLTNNSLPAMTILVKQSPQDELGKLFMDAANKQLDIQKVIIGISADAAKSYNQMQKAIEPLTDAIQDFGVGIIDAAAFKAVYTKTVDDFYEATAHIGLFDPKKWDKTADTILNKAPLPTTPVSAVPIHAPYEPFIGPVDANYQALVDVSTYTANDVKALEQYTTFTFKKANDGLRDGIKNPISAATQKFIDEFDTVVAKHTLANDTTLYRGVQLHKMPTAYQNLQVGDVIDELGYLSTSISQDVAKTYATKFNSSDPAVFVLNVPAGTAYGLPDVARGSIDQELVLAHGSTLQITSVSKDLDGTIVYHANVTPAATTAPVSAVPAPSAPIAAAVPSKPYAGPGSDWDDAWQKAQTSGTVSAKNFPWAKDDYMKNHPSAGYSPIVQEKGAQFPNMTKGQQQMVSATQAYTIDFPLMDVELAKADFIATQTGGVPAIIDKYIKNMPQDKFPRAYIWKGQYHLTNGHHRVMAAHIRGDKFLTVQVINLDALPDVAWQGALQDLADSLPAGPGAIPSTKMPQTKQDKMGSYSPVNNPAPSSAPVTSGTPTIPVASAVQHQVATPAAAINGTQHVNALLTQANPQFAAAADAKKAAKKAANDKFYAKKKIEVELQTLTPGTVEHAQMAKLYGDIVSGVVVTDAKAVEALIIQVKTPTIDMAAVQLKDQADELHNLMKSIGSTMPGMSQTNQDIATMLTDPTKTNSQKLGEVGTFMAAMKQSENNLVHIMDSVMTDIQALGDTAKDLEALAIKLKVLNGNTTLYDAVGELHALKITPTTSSNVVQAATGQKQYVHSGVTTPEFYEAVSTGAVDLADELIQHGNMNDAQKAADISNEVDTAVVTWANGNMGDDEFFDLMEDSANALESLAAANQLDHVVQPLINYIVNPLPVPPVSALINPAAAPVPVATVHDFPVTQDFFELKLEPALVDLGNELPGTQLGKQLDGWKNQGQKAKDDWSAGLITEDEMNQIFDHIAIQVEDIAQQAGLEWVVQPLTDLIKVGTPGSTALPKAAAIKPPPVAWINPVSVGSTGDAMMNDLLTAKFKANAAYEKAHFAYLQNQEDLVMSAKIEFDTGVFNAKQYADELGYIIDSWQADVVVQSYVQNFAKKYNVNNLVNPAGAVTPSAAGRIWIDPLDGNKIYHQMIQDIYNVKTDALKAKNATHVYKFENMHDALITLHDDLAGGVLSAEEFSDNLAKVLQTWKADVDVMSYNPSFTAGYSITKVPSVKAVPPVPVVAGVSPVAPVGSIWKNGQPYSFDTSGVSTTSLASAKSAAKKKLQDIAANTPDGLLAYKYSMAQNDIVSGKIVVAKGSQGDEIIKMIQDQHKADLAASDALAVSGHKASVIGTTSPSDMAEVSDLSVNLKEDLDELLHANPKAVENEIQSLKDQVAIMEHKFLTKKVTLDEWAEAINQMHYETWASPWAVNPPSTVQSKHMSPLILKKHVTQVTPPPIAVPIPTAVVGNPVVSYNMPMDELEAVFNGLVDDLHKLSNSGIPSANIYSGYLKDIKIGETAFNAGQLALADYANKLDDALQYIINDPTALNKAPIFTLDFMANPNQVPGAAQNATFTAPPQVVVKAFDATMPSSKLHAAADGLIDDLSKISNSMPSGAAAAPYDMLANNLSVYKSDYANGFIGPNEYAGHLDNAFQSIIKDPDALNANPTFSLSHQASLPSAAPVAPVAPVASTIAPSPGLWSIGQPLTFDTAGKTAGSLASAKSIGKKKLMALADAETDHVLKMAYYQAANDVASGKILLSTGSQGETVANMIKISTKQGTGTVVPGAKMASMPAAPITAAPPPPPPPVLTFEEQVLQSGGWLPGQPLSFNTVGKTSGSLASAKSVGKKKILEAADATTNPEFKKALFQAANDVASGKIILATPGDSLDVIDLVGFVANTNSTDGTAMAIAQAKLMTNAKNKPQTIVQLSSAGNPLITSVSTKANPTYGWTPVTKKPTPTELKDNLAYHQAGGGPKIVETKYITGTDVEASLADVLGGMNTIQAGKINGMAMDPSSLGKQSVMMSQVGSVKYLQDTVDMNKIEAAIANPKSGRPIAIKNGNDYIIVGNAESFIAAQINGATHVEMRVLTWDEVKALGITKEYQLHPAVPGAPYQGSQYKPASAVAAQNLLQDIGRRHGTSGWHAEAKVRRITAQAKNDPRYTQMIAKEFGGNEDAFFKFMDSAIDTWAGNSSMSPIMVAFHTSAMQEFNVQNAKLTPNFMNTLKGAQAQNYLNTKGQAMQVGLRAMYDVTQSEFKQAGITHVAGHRGYGFKNNAPNLPNEYRIYKKGDEFEAELSALPLTSWSTSASKASGFGSSKAWGYVTKAEIPVENILSFGTTGFGTGTSELEFIGIYGAGTVHHKVLNTH